MIGGLVRASAIASRCLWPRPPTIVSRHQAAFIGQPFRTPDTKDAHGDLFRPFVSSAIMATANGLGEAVPTAVGWSEAEVDYRPHSVPAGTPDWVDDLELEGAQQLGQSSQGAPLRVLVLYGSLRERSFSKFLAYEFARILERLGAEVRVFNPAGLPMKDGTSEKHPKVVEIRELSQWSEAHVWVCPEQHGTITAVFKNQIDWVPLSLGSVRPSQGRTLAIAQVNGGSQSFNTVNTLRVLGRWMRMITIPNQSSVPKAWTEFDDEGRMKASNYRDRVVDVAEELFKFSILLRGQSDFLVDRFSERKEKLEKGRLLSQAEKEAEKARQVLAAPEVRNTPQQAS